MVTRVTKHSRIKGFRRHEAYSAQTGISCSLDISAQCSEYLDFLAKFTFLEGAKLRLTFSPGHDDSERKTIALPRTAMQKETHIWFIRERRWGKMFYFGKLTFKVFWNRGFHYLLFLIFFFLIPSMFTRLSSLILLKAWCRMIMYGTA